MDFMFFVIIILSKVESETLTLGTFGRIICIIGG